MNSRERVAIAMRGGQPDRVPVMCQLALGHYFLNCGLAPHEIWFSSDGFADALLMLRDRYRFDGILINIPGRPEGCLEEIQALETGPDGETLTWSNGDVLFFPWDDNPYYIKAAREPFHPAFEAVDPDDLDFLDECSGYVWGVYHIPRLAGRRERGPLKEIPDYFYRTIDRVLERSGGEFSVHGEVFSPFTHFMELLGYEYALMGLIMDPGKAHALLQVFTESVIAWALGQVSRGVDAVLISSAFAGGPFLSRAMYAEFVLPYERQVAAAVKTAGGIVYTHTCGRIGDRLDLMEETGTLGIDTLDPPPLGSAELAEAKAQLGSRVFIKGNMNSVDLLKHRTKDEVIAHAASRIQTGKPGGGYILSTACSVAPRVEPWKLELLVPLAEELGKYEA
jgi:uroporphyrinogen-III decarboxylase